MKQITIKCFSNGTTTTDIEYLYFDRENDTTQVTIEYPQEVASWHKRADILVGFDKTVDFKVGTGEKLSFLLGAEHLKKGYLTIQSVCDKKIYSRKCFGHPQTKSIFPFKSIRYYDTIDSEFDDLLKML